MANIQFNLRVPEELKQKIDEASAKSGRSINAEATYRLEQSFDNLSDTISLEKYQELVKMHKETNAMLRQMSELILKLDENTIED